MGGRKEKKTTCFPKIYKFAVFITFVSPCQTNHQLSSHLDRDRDNGESFAEMVKNKQCFPRGLSVTWSSVHRTDYSLIIYATQSWLCPPEE